MSDCKFHSYRATVPIKHPRAVVTRCLDCGLVMIGFAPALQDLFKEYYPDAPNL